MGWVFFLFEGNGRRFLWLVIGFCFYVDMLQENFKNIIKNNKIIGFLIYDGISHIRQINIYQIKSDQREGISLPLLKKIIIALIC